MSTNGSSEDGDALEADSHQGPLAAAIRRKRTTLTCLHVRWGKRRRMATASTHSSCQIAC